MQQNDSVGAIARQLNRSPVTNSRKLIAGLRHAHSKRVTHSKGRGRRGQIMDMLRIHVRPLKIEERQFSGHWEGDLIKAEGNTSALGTLVECPSRLLMLVKLPQPKAATAANVLQAFRDKLPSVAKPMRQRMTYVQGQKVAPHKNLPEKIDAAVYYCDPHIPWQRGSNENTNRLRGQYLPKGTDLSIYREDQFDPIANEINKRPRKGLGVRSPLAVNGVTPEKHSVIHPHSLKPRACTSNFRPFLLHINASV